MTLSTSFPKVELSGVLFDRVTERQTCQHVRDAIAQGTGGFIVTANLDHLVRCRRNPSYLQLVRDADLVVADGMPLIWASRLQGTPLPERVAGSTLCLSLAEGLAQDGRSVYLLGGNEGVAEHAAQSLKERFAGLKIAGTFYPPFGFEKDQDAVEQIRTAISRITARCSLRGTWFTQTGRTDRKVAP